MNKFKDKAIQAIIDHLPDEDDPVLADTGKIRLTESKDIGNHIKKCTMVIQWEETILNPCRGCPGYEYACSCPTEVGEKGDEE